MPEGRGFTALFGKGKLSCMKTFANTKLFYKCFVTKRQKGACAPLIRGTLGYAATRSSRREGANVMWNGFLLVFLAVVVVWPPVT